MKHTLPKAQRGAAHLFELDGNIVPIKEGDVIPGSPVVKCACRSGFYFHDGPHEFPPFRVAMATKLPGSGYSLRWLSHPPTVDFPVGFAKRRREAVRWLRRVAADQKR